MIFLQTFKEFIETKINKEIDIMKQHLQKLKKFKKYYEKYEEIMLKMIYNEVLLSNVSEIYKMIVNILESQNQFMSIKIINRFLKEYRKIADLKNDEMKMILLTNQKQKVGKKRKSRDKTKDKIIKKCSIYFKPRYNKKEY